MRPPFFLLQQAGAAVKKATETLVKAAQDSQDNVTEEEAKINVRALELAARSWITTPS